MIGLSLSSSSTLTFPLKSLSSNPTKSSFHGVSIGLFSPAGGPISSSSSSVRTTGSSSSAVVVKIAKREVELEEIRGRSTEEINEEIIDLKGELFMLRLQRSARNEFKSSEFRRMRKRVARMLTVRREREIEEGIGKRLSRKLDRKWKKSIVVRPPPSLKKLQEEAAAEEAKESSSA